MGISITPTRLVLAPPKPRMATSTYLRFQGQIQTAKGKNYKDLKNMDGNLRSAYHNDALTGEEFINLLRNLWSS